MSKPIDNASETGGRSLLLGPQPEDPRLTRTVSGRDERGEPLSLRVVVERPLTLYLNGTEILTLMTVGDHPDYLAIGFLRNQNMLAADDEITAVDVDEDLGVVVVRTRREASYQQKLQKKVRTSGCAQGTVFGDIMESFDTVSLNQDLRIETKVLQQLLDKINRLPCLYQSAGAIHGCALCSISEPMVYMEDVGRHNAVDKIAGYMYQHGLNGRDKVFFTTGRLTSEMVIKAVQMEIPVLVSRSGFTEWGVSLAKTAGLTLIGRAKGRRFITLSGEHRLVYSESEGREPGRLRRGRGVI